MSGDVLLSRSDSSDGSNPCLIMNGLDDTKMALTTPLALQPTVDTTTSARCIR